MAQDNATLVERIELDPTLVIFRIRPDAVPAPGEPWFLPGQYVTIGASAIQRAYSIASEPDERRWLEFYIRFAREPATASPLTHVLWKMRTGERLHIGEKIAGRFTLQRTVPAGDTRVKLLVAAGTGIAPFVSMVRHAVRTADAATLARLAVLHGVSHPHELAFRDELTDVASRFGLRYLPTVSRPAGHPEWKGLTGRVESLLDDGRLDAFDLSPEKAVVYVCGFKDTIAGSVLRLLGRSHIPEDRRLRRMLGIADGAKPSLFYEQYDLEPVFDPNDAALIASLRVKRGQVSH
jgi:ferredoxin/flavodoxin---NADP+ reductase